MFSIQCPQCLLRYSVADQLAGKKARCRCGHVFPIPALAPAASPNPSGTAGHDVFISYSSIDKVVAFAVCAALEGGGVRCWIAPNSIVPGSDYGAAIIEGINNCQVFVLVLSGTANTSKQVKFEIERAASKGKRLLPFRIHAVPLSPSLEYFLSSSHWLDATSLPPEKHLPRLVKAVKELLPSVGPAVPAPATVEPAAAQGETARWQQALTQGRLTVELSADDDRKVALLAALVGQDMAGKGFATADGKKTSVVLRELVNNVKVHVADPSKWVRVMVEYLEPVDGVPSEVSLTIQDRGAGFDLDATLEKLWDKLHGGEREHGLLRAIRYGTSLTQSPSERHAIVWTRHKRPATLASAFDGLSQVVPLVFEYGSDLIRIGSDVYLGEELLSMERFKEGLHDLVFEPIRRSAAPVIGLEVRGEHHTLAGHGAGPFLRSLWRFRTAAAPAKRLVVLLDTEREDHVAICRFRERTVASCRTPAERDVFTVFEDREECLRSLGGG